MKKASDLFVECLVAEGVKQIYGVPGEEIADLILSLEASPIRFIPCRHEQAAAFMADAEGRLTGHPGVCLATLGPGATNLLTGVANADMDNSPVVAVTGQASTYRMHKESHQHMDIVSLFEPVTKWNHGIRRADNIPEVVRKAFKTARLEKPGACHIELPEDVAGLHSNKVPLLPRNVALPTPDRQTLDEAEKLIRRADEILILAGNGAVRRNACQALLSLAKALGVGVVNTFMAKGVVPRNDPHCLFTIGLQARDHISCGIDRADLIVAVGYDLVEYPPRLWNQGRPKKILHIDYLPAEVDEDYRPEVELIGDVRKVLEDLAGRFWGTAPLKDIRSIFRLRESMMEEFNAFADDDTAGSIRPQKAVADLRAMLGPDDILISDVGAHKMWVGRYYQCDRPNTCLISNGFCSMGFALPAAIAAKYLRPERRVVGLCGDGGVLMNIQDLETAVRLQIPVVIMIWQDNDYGLISWKQRTHFGKNADMTFGNPDFVELARAFGAWGKWVDRSVDLRPALEEAFRQDKPAILAMPVDYSENDRLTKRLGEIVCPI